MDYSYLRPPKEVYNVKHDEFYIKHGEGMKHQRKIFFNQQFDEFELSQIANFQLLLKQQAIVLPNDWNDQSTLKYLYSTQFDHQKTLEKLKKHLAWRIDPLYQELTPLGEEYLRKGFIYTFGRDFQFRPVIYIPLYFFGKLDLPSYFCAATHLCNVVQKYMFVPGFVENWIVIIDLNGQGVFDTNFSVIISSNIILKTIAQINDILQVNFNSTLHKMFILDPSFFFFSTWKMISKMIKPETNQKINFLKKTEYKKLQEYIPASQIEMKYGGEYQNLTLYWQCCIFNLLIINKGQSLIQIKVKGQPFYFNHQKTPHQTQMPINLQLLIIKAIWKANFIQLEMMKKIFTVTQFFFKIKEQPNEFSQYKYINLEKEQGKEILTISDNRKCCLCSLI